MSEKQKKLRNIYLEFIEFDEDKRPRKTRKDLDCSVLSVHFDREPIENERFMYMYELLYFPEIEDKINSTQSLWQQYTFDVYIHSAFTVSISEQTFKFLKEYLTKHTEWEYDRLEEELFLLRAIVNSQRQNPKMWD